jgi:hypothetical protein
MNAEKESSKPETSEQQPKAPQVGELREEQLDRVTGGAGGSAPRGPGPAPPGG